MSEERMVWFYKWGLPITLGVLFIGFFMLMFWLQDQPWWGGVT